MKEKETQKDKRQKTKTKDTKITLFIGKIKNRV
jgi:hypothetical protein